MKYLLLVAASSYRGETEVETNWDFSRAVGLVAEQWPDSGQRQIDLEVEPD